MDIDWKSIVKSVAPVIGTALGGPLAGTAVKFLAEGLLGNPDASESDVAAAIAGASPDTLLKLRELDAEFKIKMKQLDIDVFRLEVDDRKSAREMAKVNFLPQITLSVIYTVGYFGLLWQFATGDVVIPVASKDILVALIGAMTAAQVQIMNFWFGSSYGSKEKTAKLGV